MKKDKVTGAVSHVFSFVGAIAILTILVVTVADVIMSKIFGVPFPGATEVITTVMPISVFAFLLTTQMRSRHIRIDMLLERIGKKWQHVMTAFSLGIGIYLFGLLTYLTVPLAIYSVHIGEHTGGSIGIPIYPAKIIIPIATGIMTIQLLIELYREGIGFFTGADNMGGQ